MEGVVARSSTIPEELGRISYLLSDKTGTLTKNEMTFRKLHIGSQCYNDENFDKVRIQSKIEGIERIEVHKNFFYSFLLPSKMGNTGPFVTVVKPPTLSIPFSRHNDSQNQQIFSP